MSTSGATAKSFGSLHGFKSQFWYRLRVSFAMINWLITFHGRVPDRQRVIVVHQVP